MTNEMTIAYICSLREDEEMVFQDIANYLNTNGILTARKKQWSKANVCRVYHQYYG